MKECWHSDPKKRPSATDIFGKIREFQQNELIISYVDNQTRIIKSADIGPIAMNNPGAIYKSRPLSRMMQSAMSLRSSRCQPINFETGKLFNDTNFTFILIRILTLLHF
ncbi:hypothetical protein RclHR1_06460008 [Rhizophagus clarus]|uniref:Serine-threonine/tyrosine-protein kinase catalytic domain-containing protein n=1 Tax=Rhizophagus clarus TaxID=94130 RepID=A0A2Z6RHE2_9GLOM|nr:hypothetical protein RclHR1_38850001 [Rhizophagus clarus]GBC05837.1 hypothetical protein RclHR1_06460008 [Rhizophagus clarus]